MKRILCLVPLLAFIAACGDSSKKSCKTTGCAAGSLCNLTTGLCEVPMSVGGGSGETGGGSGGGSGGGGGSTTGGGSGGGGGVIYDAGIPEVDPLDDGGVFVAGDICGRSIPVVFDGGIPLLDGGVAIATSLTVDLSTFENQYTASCNNSATDTKDVVFQLQIPSLKVLTVSAVDLTANGDQDAVLDLIKSPCATQAPLSCVDTSSDPETLTARLQAGTYYLLLENYGAGDEGEYRLDFELTDAPPAPANDTCGTATPIAFISDHAAITGTTIAASNDTDGRPFSCSSDSEQNSDVFYKFTLTQPHDVRVDFDTPLASSLYPAVVMTRDCSTNPTVAFDELACDTGGAGNILGRNLPAGTYYVVVDGDNAREGDFNLDVTLLPPTLPPGNDTCLMPDTLTPNTTLNVDSNAAAHDYDLTCSSGNTNGDVVYQFTTSQAQSVTITATGTGGADAILSLRAAPCDSSSGEIDCSDLSGSFSPEELHALNLPAGTYFVVLQAYSSRAGQFGISLELGAPILPPPNDTCSAPATLVAGVSQSVTLTAAAHDFTAACSTATGGDAVYEFTLQQSQKVTITAIGTGTADATLDLRTGPCASGSSIQCRNETSSATTEAILVGNLAAGTYYVVITNDSGPATFDIQLTLDPAVPPPANDTCLAPEVITFSGSPVMRTVDLTSATPDVSENCGSFTATGGDAMYAVSVGAGQTLTVTGEGPLVDVVLFARAPPCDTAPSVQCADDEITGGQETLVLTNSTAAAVTYYIVVQAYRVSAVVDLTFTLQ